MLRFVSWMLFSSPRLPRWGGFFRFCDKPTLPKIGENEHYLDMTAGFHRSLLVATLAGTSFLAAPLHAQDPVQTELVELRKLIMEQKDQIARLTTEVARANALLDGLRPMAAAPAIPPAAAGTPAVASVATPAEPARPTVVAPPPKVHVVVKGDSLEKIAKQHGIATIDLQKLNKISDPKKLQIGQSLILPANAVMPNAETPAEKPADKPAEKTEKKDPQ